MTGSWTDEICCSSSWVGQDVMDLFSSCAVAISGELRRLAAELPLTAPAVLTGPTLWRETQAGIQAADAGSSVSSC